MRRSRWLPMLVLPALLALGGCGARMGTGQSKGGSSQDGGATDGPSPRRDRGSPLDMQRPDSCLPIPAIEVRGSYRGEWSGKTNCSSSLTDLSGTLTFELQPTGSSSFSVEGKMVGTITGGPGSPGIPFSATIKGGMGCTSLAAALAVDVIGTKLNGNLSGIFGAKPIGFGDGKWKVDDIAGTGCTATGVWSAKQ
jgi:hypothetical protein